MKEIMETLSAALQASKDESGGYTLEALLIGAVGVALIITLFQPVQDLFQAAINAVQALLP